jgi:hypothetical protein
MVRRVLKVIDHLPSTGSLSDSTAPRLCPCMIPTATQRLGFASHHTQSRVGMVYFHLFQFCSVIGMGYDTKLIYKYLPYQAYIYVRPALPVLDSRVSRVLRRRYNQGASDMSSCNNPFYPGDMVTMLETRPFTCPRTHLTMVCAKCTYPDRCLLRYRL